jgi:hypothetical protein
MILRKRFFLMLPVLALGLTGCDDPEMNAMMDDYCNCIQKARYDESLRVECLEKMDSITEKYKDQPRKRQQVLEKTDDCY